jgi:hypothetical protein
VETGIMTGRRSLEVSEVLDVSAARRLAFTVAAQGSGEHLVVDLRGGGGDHGDEDGAVPVAG